MPKAQMSYNTADKIINIYSELLKNLKNLDNHKKYSYSDLQGYDLIDISNALKLMIAYQVFISTDISENKNEDLKKYTEAGAAALISFLDLFYPDEVVFELNKINSNDEMAEIKRVNITKDSLAEIQALFFKEETPDSFLDYCLLRKLDPEYWENIYNRIGITWETFDDYDRIYINIALKYGIANTNKKIEEGNKVKSSAGIVASLKNFFPATKSFKDVLGIVISILVGIWTIVAIIIFFKRGISKLVYHFTDFWKDSNVLFIGSILLIGLIITMFSNKRNSNKDPT